jgi:purine-binding chemotaxis protein CheW
VTDNLESSAQFATFSADGLYFGVPVENVQEVVRYQDMTPVPLASAEIKGLINLRGQIITALDLRTSLHLSPRDDSRNPMNVVVKVNEELCSLLVDEIGDVLSLDKSALEEPPPTLPSAIKTAVTKVCQLNDRLLLVFNPSSIVK